MIPAATDQSPRSAVFFLSRESSQPPRRPASSTPRRPRLCLAHINDFARRARPRAHPGRRRCSLPTFAVPLHGCAHSRPSAVAPAADVVGAGAPVHAEAAFAGGAALAVFDGAAGTVAPDDGAAAPALTSNTGAANSAIASCPRSVSKYGTRTAGSAGRAP